MHSQLLLEAYSTHPLLKKQMISSSVIYDIFSSQELVPPYSTLPVQDNCVPYLSIPWRILNIWIISAIFLLYSREGKPNIFNLVSDSKWFQITDHLGTGSSSLDNFEKSDFCYCWWRPNTWAILQQGPSLICTNSRRPKSQTWKSFWLDPAFYLPFLQLSQYVP